MEVTIDSYLNVINILFFVKALLRLLGLIARATRWIINKHNAVAFRFFFRIFINCQILR
jgi:hypothetical protein